MSHTIQERMDYKKAGVDISEGNRTVHLIKEEAKSTFSPSVLTGLGSFASLYDMSSLMNSYRNPVLVQSVDGVGTKISVARMMNDYSTIGRDLFNACTNDIAVHGAKPITFLDYIANDSLKGEIVADIIKGIAFECRRTETSLVGGETAEMPGVYLPGEHDLVGLVTGVVEKDHIITGEHVNPGDIMLAVGSTGLHTNGYSLARKVLFDVSQCSVTDSIEVGSHKSIGSILLEPHANYTIGIQRLLTEHVPIKSMAHITGGGLWENVPRVIPSSVNAHFYPTQWESQKIFSFIQELGSIDDYEMYRTFNMGIGLVIIVSEEDAHDTLSHMKDVFEQPVWEVGVIEQGEGKSIIEGITS